MLNANEVLFEFLFRWSGQNWLFDDAVVFLAKFFPYLLILGSLLWLSSLGNWKSKFSVFAEGMMAIILSRGIITELVRFFYENPRPFAALDITPLIVENSSSFPSGHAAFFFAMATTIFYYNRRIGWWFFGFAVLNGLARVVAGAHWPLDIVGGVIVGVVSAILVHELLKKYSGQIIAKESTPD